MNPAAVPPNPYVGLRPFESEDSLYYFGRNEQTRALLRLLGETRFLAVVGSSGCGKSSLVRAGLIPHLHAGFLVQDRDLWRIARLKPGDNPLRNLASALAEANAEPAAAEALSEAIRTGGASALLAGLQPELDGTGSNLLLLVDQFEELFRYARPEDPTERREEAAAFVALLLDLTESPGAPVYLCLTMRSDFLGDCDAYCRLPEAMNRGQYLVPRLTRAQRREAILGPAHLSGAAIAPRLVDRLLNENIGTRDDLPVLQHALMRTWENWREAGTQGPMDLSHYEATGTIHGALDRDAESALEEAAALGEGYQDIPRRLFQCLTEVDATHRRIRRPARLREIAAVADSAPERVWAVMGKFRENHRNFLVLSSGNPADDPMVDISHESLIRQWKTLSYWVEEEARSARMYRRLEEAAWLHVDAGTELWRGVDLGMALEWREQTRPSRAWAERYGPGFRLAMEFLDQSRQSEQEEAERKERERRRETRRNRLLAWVMTALFAVSFLSAAGIAWWAHQANEQELKARRLLYVANLNLAQSALENRSYAAANALLLEFLPAPGAKPSEDLRGFTWYHLWRAAPSPRNTLRGHRNTVSSVAISPDGRTLASGSRDNTVKLWDLATGREIANLTGHGDAVTSVAFAPDGRTLAAGNGDGTIALWDLTTGKTTANLARHGDSVTSVAFSPNGRTLASGSRDATIKLWDLATGEATATLAGHTSAVYSVAFAPDGRILASGSRDETVKLWDLATGKASATLAGHGADVYSVAFAPDGRILASGSRNGTVKLWDLATGRETATLAGHGANVYSVAFAPDGRTLASGSWDGTVKLWDLATGKATATLAGHGAIVYSVAFAPDGRTLVSGSLDETVKLWDIATGRETATLTGHAYPVTSVAFAPDGRTLASGSWDETVKLWDLATGKATATLAGHTSAVYSVAFAPDGRTLASGSWDETVKLWDIASRKETTEADLGTSVWSVAFAPDGRTLASGSEDGTIGLWDIATGRETAILAGHEHVPYSVAFAPDGRTLASGGRDQTVKLWDIATGRETATLSGHSASVRSVAFAPDGRTLASGSEDGTIRLWDIAIGRETATLSGHSASVWSVAFAPDGRTLASGSEDGTIRLWDISTGKETATLVGHADTVRSVAFAPDGRTLAAGFSDGTIGLWFGATDEEVERQRNR